MSAPTSRGKVLVVEPADFSPDLGGLAGVLSALCRLALPSIPAAGASVTLVSDGGIPELLCSTDPVAAKLADMQFGLGEGPAPESLKLSRPVLLEDLAVAPLKDLSGRVFLLPNLVDAARELDVGSMFALPLRVGGAVRLGVLELYRVESLAISEESLARAQQLADAVTHAVLSLAGASENGVYGPGDELSHQRAVVHQATGMVMAQVGGTITDAFARLRAHAFATGATITETASAIVTRELRLQRDDGSTQRGGPVHDET